MAGNGCNGWKWLEMAGIARMAKMAGKLLEMAENSWKWLIMAGNDWKWLEFLDRGGT